MFLLYEVLTIIVIIFSPFIFFFRLIFGKEDPKRILEKFCIYSKNYKNTKTVWFHGASVGEILSIIPIIQILEKNKKIKKILLTSSTKSSALIFRKYRFKKTTHVYYPIDENNLTKRFINYWQPKLAIFIDSEIWPNMFKNLSKKEVPIILINGRITSKSYYRWIKFKKFSREIFSKITLTLPQNTESFKYLKKLGVRRVKIAGNLKYFGQSKNFQDKSIKQKFKNRLIFCAASTHHNEELFIGKLHKELKTKYKNLLTIIIPRHINRADSIINDLEGINLNLVTRSSGQKISKSTDIYIADTYGEASKFYKLSKITFLGGSLINHGGQNPLEAARMGNYILHGPNIQNFKEVYKMLSKFNISSKARNTNIMKKIIDRKIGYKRSSKIIKKLNSIGNGILKKNLIEINRFL